MKSVCKGLSSALILILVFASNPAWPAKRSNPGGNGGTTDPAPALAFSGSSAVIAYGGSITLSWSSSNARRCDASGAWSGSKPLSGSEQIAGITSTVEFVLSCQKKGRSVSASVVVAVDPATVPPPPPPPAPAPSVDLRSDATTVPYEGSAILSWNSQYANGCQASGGWSGDVGVQGSTAVGPLTSSKTFAITCDGAGGTAYSAVSVTVELTASTDVTSPGTIGDGRLDAIVESIRKSYAIPALAVVVTRYGQVAEASATGVRALGTTNYVTLDDQWHLGSLTKAITGTLMGAAVEAGIISWSTRPVDVWPDLGPSMHPQYVNATLRHLLTHTAGVINNVWSVPSMSQIEDYASGTLVQKRKLWATELLRAAPEAPAGSFHYSNGGYIIAAAMLEALAHSDWESLVRRHVLDPLGMSRTGFGAPGTDEPYGHRTTSSGLQPVAPGPGADNPLAMAPAGGIHASLNDYAAFMLAHLSGAQGVDGVVSKETMKYLQTAYPATDYGIGWFVWTNGTLSHVGSNTLWQADVRVLPSLDAGLFVVANAADVGTQNGVRAALELLNRRVSNSL